MIAYKLVRKMKDGSLSPLFINKKSRLVLGEWMEAEDVPTKGFKHRKGWHCALEPKLPHLTMNGRVWIEVEVEDYKLHNRPKSQGGEWVLAQKMKVNKILTK